MGKFMKGTAAVCLLLAVACGGDGPTQPTVDDSFIGNFSLRTINGQKLPYVIVQQGANSVTVTEDHVSITNGGTWTEVATYSVVTNGSTVSQVGGSGGTWTRSGNQLALTSGTTNALEYTGTFSNGTLTMNGAGSTAFVFVWAK